MSAFDHILWDASGLVKRYIVETRSESVDAIFAETADKRLLRAAEAEGLKTLNPELLSPDDVPAFLARL